jgi:hypothetical protein|tara:strand:+ start:1036 stop:1251 length:216 start_codon:yes stop_codon:yes gene_type:complete
MYINKVNITIEDPKNPPPSVADAILALNANAKFTIINDDIDRLTWLESFTPIASSDIMTKYNELKATYDAG